MAMTTLRRLASPAALALLLALPAAAQEAEEEGLAPSDDRHVGYYYPVPQSEETYVARATILPQASRELRLAFVTQLTQQQFQAPYAPGLAIFAKGADAEKLIMVALRDELFDTIYRVRGVLAMMTASARGSELFRNYHVQDIFTFFDLLKLLGFERLTVTDGRGFAHVVHLQ